MMAPPTDSSRAAPDAATAEPPGIVRVRGVSRAEPNRTALIGGAALAFAGLIAIVVALVLAAPLSAPLLAFGLGALVFGGFATQSMRKRMTRVGPRDTLQIDNGSVTFANTLLASPGRISAGVVFHHDIAHRVRLSRGALLPPLEFVVADAEQGRRVLEALGLDARHTVGRFWVDGPSWDHWKLRWAAAVFAPVSFFALLWAVHAGGFGSLVPFLLPLMTIALVLGVAQLFAPARVTIGADGILVRWLWQSRFIPIREIESVRDAPDTSLLTVYPKGLLLQLTSGRTEEILVSVGRTGVIGEYGYVIKPLEERRRMVKGRIEEAIAAARKGGAVEEAFVLPARGPRKVEEWVTELRQLMGQPGYRVQAAPLRDQLWRAVEDPSAEPQERAAAAVSLGASLDDTGRQRLRVLAHATAAPRLRVVIEAVADQDDDRLAQALDDVAPEGSAPARREPS